MQIKRGILWGGCNYGKEFVFNIFDPSSKDCMLLVFNCTILQFAIIHPIIMCLTP